MGRRQSSTPKSFAPRAILIIIFIISCYLIYAFFPAFSNSNNKTAVSLNSKVEENYDDEEEECCRGINGLELWGEAVKWGSEFRVNSSQECCMACKDMCDDDDDDCKCNSWVYCGDKKACGSRFGECWLKRQMDILNPERKESGNHVTWTSGLVYRRGQGIVGLETQYGTIHIELLPDCAPHSVFYILQLLAARHCAGCHFYRAESRGSFWDSGGNHIKNTPFGPPFALVQGKLEAQGMTFREIRSEYCPHIKRGSVAWVGSGPEFFISLANHNEWRKSYTVFGSVIPEDMEIAEKIARLPTKPEVWSNINVSVLENYIPVRVHRKKFTPKSNKNRKMTAKPA